MVLLICYGTWSAFNHHNNATITTTVTEVQEIEEQTIVDTPITPKIEPQATNLPTMDNSSSDTKPFVITAYCPCYECSGGWGNSTSTGAVATQGRTIAVDPTVIPYGTKVVIDGHTYIAEDCGGAIKGNKIDLYFDNHQDACNWGRQTREVTILNE